MDEWMDSPALIIFLLMSLLIPTLIPFKFPLFNSSSINSYVIPPPLLKEELMEKLKQ